MGSNPISGLLGAVCPPCPRFTSNAVKGRIPARTFVARAVRADLAIHPGSQSVPSPLSHHHRTTLEHIFDHQGGGNVEWLDVVSLLEVVGTVHEESNGTIKVALGPETETLHRPHGKDVDLQVLVDLRRILDGAGYGPRGTASRDDEMARDHGDGRWGSPEAEL